MTFQRLLKRYKEPSEKKSLIFLEIASPYIAQIKKKEIVASKSGEEIKKQCYI